MKRILWLFVAFFFASNPNVNATIFQLYDGFDNGDLSGWSYDGGSRFYGASNSNTVLPVLASSPDGFAIRGPDNSNLGGWMERQTTFDAAASLSVGMEARSADGWPNHASIWLWESGGDHYYRFYIFGENQTCWFEYASKNTGAILLIPLAIPGGVYSDWNAMTWQRDSSGSWSFFAGGQVIENFVNEKSITSFDQIYVNVGGSQSQIEWLGVAATPEPCTLMLLAFGAAALRLKPRV